MPDINVSAKAGKEASRTNRIKRERKLEKNLGIAASTVTGLLRPGRSAGAEMGAVVVNLD
jgi:hypothetical protein